jgi:hypothetical protein
MLGSERMQKIKMVGQAEVENSFYGQLVLGKGVSARLDEHLANEAAKAGKFFNCVFGTEGFAFINFF